MRDDLVPVQIEINPALTLSPGATPEHIHIKIPRALKIVDGKREMKRRLHKRSVVGPPWTGEGG